MRETTERDSLTIDDLVVGRRYEFITPRGYVYRGVWQGIDWYNGALEVPPGTWDLFPHGAIFVRPVRTWASCTITPMEPLHATEERLDFNENLRRHLASCRAADAKRARPWRLAVFVGCLAICSGIVWWLVAMAIR